MFNGKKIKELDAKISELEQRVETLVKTVKEQNEEIDRLYMSFIKQDTAKAIKQEQSQSKKKYRPRKKNGKENTEATK